MSEDSIDYLIVKAEEAAILAEELRKACLELHKKNSSVNLAYWAWISADKAQEQLDECVEYLERFRGKSSKEQGPK